ncbi:hypothetical protein D3C80_1884770 [compost metagenome]
MPVSPEARLSPFYVEGVCCDRCHDTRTDEQREGYAERQKQMEIAAWRGVGHVGAAQKQTSPLPMGEGLSARERSDRSCAKG